MSDVSLGLIVGGVQKAGTTSLFGYLRDHPKLIAPTHKELHFFDDEGHDWNSSDYSRISSFFDPRGDQRIAFEVTPIYLFWPNALERISNYNPEVKLIFVFRDPIERAWSHWRMSVDRFGESLSFSEAIRRGRSRLIDQRPLGPEWRYFSYVERGFYARQVRRLYNLFPKENILLLRSSDLNDQHQSVLTKIAEFLGITDFPLVEARMDHQGVDAGQKMQVADIVYLRDVFHEDTVDFSRLTKLSVDDWLVMASDGSKDYAAL